MAAFPITVAGPLASNAQPAAAARQQAAQDARTARKSAAARPTARATRQSGPDGSSLVAQLRDRHGPPPLATAESAARDRAAGRSRSTVLSSRTAEGADVNPILVHRVVPRIERDHRHGPVRAVLGSTRLGGGPQGRDDRVWRPWPAVERRFRQRLAADPTQPRGGQQKRQVQDRIHVRLGRRLEPETRTDWTLWRKPAERMYHDAPDTTCCLPHDTRRQVSTSGHLRTNPARNSWNSRPGSGPGYDLPAVLADHTCRAGHNQL